MKFYEITIRPLSAFGTSLKGDTLFGHFCWQVAYDSSLVEGGLERALAAYDHKPFVIFSSAFSKFEDDKTYYVVPRPDVPLSWFFPTREMSCEERYRRMKELKPRKWMYLTEGLRLEISKAEFMDDTEAAANSMSMKRHGQAGFINRFTHTHNSINRLTQTTGEGEFAPFLTESSYYYPESELAVFALVDEEMTDIGRVVSALESIGRFGFGRDASTGLGRFEVCESAEIHQSRPDDANACYTLAPCVPEKALYQKTYFSPFVRFGKHGDRLATGSNPFKNPVVMADEGAVVIPKDRTLLERDYAGTAVFGVSKTEPGSVVQGYAPCLPFRMEH